MKSFGEITQATEIRFYANRRAICFSLAALYIKESVDNETGAIAFVPQMSRSEVQIELCRAQHAHYAHAVFLSICVSVANKGSLNQLPKLKVASSILVARSKFFQENQF